MSAGEGASGELDVAITSEPGLMSFLVKKSRASKMLMTIQIRARAPERNRGGACTFLSVPGDRRGQTPATGQAFWAGTSVKTAAGAVTRLRHARLRPLSRR